MAVGFKDEYIMHALDFEEFLCANGYREATIETLLTNMVCETNFNTDNKMTLEKRCHQSTLKEKGIWLVLRK